MKISDELIEKIVAEIEASEDEILEKVKKYDYYYLYDIRLVIEGVDYCSCKIKVKELLRVNKIYTARFPEPTQEFSEISFEYYVESLYVDDDEVDKDIVNEIDNKVRGYIERTNFIER